MRLKVGIIGTGNMGRNHVRLVREMRDIFELTSVYDPDSERIQALDLADFQAKSEDELIEKSDAVIIAAPSSLHKELAMKVAEKGRHALVEKPLALSEDDATVLCDAFRKSGKVLMVGHVERFNPVVIELEKIVEKEEIVAIHIERCSSMDKRISDTDVVYDLMIHDVDILLNGILPGVEVKTLTALGTRVYSQNFADYVESLVQFENGVIASVISSRTTEDKIRRINVHCRNSFVEADLLNRKLSISRKTVMNLNVGYDPAYRQENIVEKVFIANEEPLRAELKHFYQCIENNSVPKNNGEDAAKSIRHLDMIKKCIY